MDKLILKEKKKSGKYKGLTSTKVTNRYAAALLESPKIGTPSSANVWNLSGKKETKY